MNENWTTTLGKDAAKLFQSDDFRQKKRKKKLIPNAFIKTGIQPIIILRYLFFTDDVHHTVHNGPKSSTIYIIISLRRLK